MATARNGFTPLRTPDTRYVRNMPVNALAKEVAKGDAVIMRSGLCLAASAGTNPAAFGFGVVLAVYTTAGRPLTHQTVKFIASGNVGRADVCWDPDMSYHVQCVTSVGASNIGGNVMIDVSGANSRLGISGMSVDIPASASINELFKIIGFSPLEPTTALTGSYTQGQLNGAANNGVEVVWNFHFLRSGIAAQ